MSDPGYALMGRTKRLTPPDGAAYAPLSGGVGGQEFAKPGLTTMCGSTLPKNKPTCARQGVYPRGQPSLNDERMDGLFFHTK